MKVILCLSGSRVAWSGRWCYLGSNYLEMREWSERMSGERISLRKRIQDESENQRPKILDWIKSQREANGDSLHWNMSHLAGRNNTVSKFFIYLIQIVALKHWIKDCHDNRKPLLVVCEDSFLMLAVRDNLTVEMDVELKDWKIRYVQEWCYYLALAGYVFIRQVAWFCIHAWAARVTRPDNIQLPKEEIYIIQQCLDDKSFLKSGPLSCRYFTIFPQWLEDQGKQVFRLPWLYNVKLPILKIYKRLRQDNCLVPQDWLNFTDYLKALWSGGSSFICMRTNILYSSKISVRYLVVRERLQHVGHGINSSEFWCYKKMLEKFTSKADKTIIYSHYEVMIPEHVQNYISNISEGAIVSIGYYHSLVSKDFLAYHHLANEEESKISPTKVVTNGDLARGVLLDQGLQSKQVVSGPALRQDFPKILKQSYNDDRQRILVVLSLMMEPAIELLDQVAMVAGWINNQLDIPVLIKPHPMTDKTTILGRVGWKDLPEGWNWFDGQINEGLEISNCAITMNTAGIVDVVLSGCIPINVARELDTPWNYLDSLEKRYELLKSIRGDELQQRLENIFITHQQYYQTQSSELMHELAGGLNHVSDESLRCFLPSYWKTGENGVKNYET